MAIVNPVPGQESRNSDFLLENGAAIKINSIATLPYKLNHLLADAERLTRLKSNAQRLGRPEAAFEIARRVLAFQSVVDATVATPALVSGLFDRLAPNGHELVLFDINRHAEIEPVLVSNPGATTAALLENRSLPFTLSVVSNTHGTSTEVSVRRKHAHEERVSEVPLNLSWPSGVLSLSHVALPFPPDDPLYGAQADPQHPGIHLGRIDVLGERGLLLFPADEVIRLRYNPFYSYVERRVTEFVDAGAN